MPQAHDALPLEVKRHGKRPYPSPDRSVDASPDPECTSITDRSSTDVDHEDGQSSQHTLSPATKKARTSEEDRRTELETRGSRSTTRIPLPPDSTWCWQGESAGGPNDHSPLQHAPRLPSPPELSTAGSSASHQAPVLHQLGQDNLYWAAQQPFMDLQAANPSGHHPHHSHLQGPALMPPLLQQQQLLLRNAALQQHGGLPQHQAAMGPPHDPYGYASSGFGRPTNHAFLPQHFIPPGHNMPMNEGQYQERSMSHMQFFPPHVDLRQVADPLPPRNHPPVCLYTRNDDEILSDYQIFVRRHIEFFQADTAEVNTAAPGRKKPVLLGQVGIRCRHCASLLADRRSAATVYFPSKLRGLYQAAQNIATTHLGDSCPSMPESIKVVFRSFQRQGRRASAGHGGRQYWADAAKASGIMETEDGLRFAR